MTRLEELLIEKGVYSKIPNWLIDEILEIGEIIQRENETSILNMEKEYQKYIDNCIESNL